jgi:hypothetical protein
MELILVGIGIAALFGMFKLGHNSGYDEALNDQNKLLESRSGKGFSDFRRTFGLSGVKFSEINANADYMAVVIGYWQLLELLARLELESDASDSEVKKVRNQLDDKWHIEVEGKTQEEIEQRDRAMERIFKK